MGNMVSNADGTYKVHVGNTKGLKGNGAPAFVEYGYGQVEPNHLSAQITGQIYAQLPAVSTIHLLQNGQFVKYNYPNMVCDFVGEGEWMLVYNEIKVYRDRDTDADFAMKEEDYIANTYNATGADMPAGAGPMVPRVFKTNIGDIFTTNTINEVSLSAGDTLTPGEDGFLAKAGAEAPGAMVWQVVKVYTMPDGQKGAKIMRIK